MKRLPVVSFFFAFSQRALVFAFATSTLVASVVSHAAASLTLQEPDFAGTFAVSASGAQPVLRDAAQGWTYFFGRGNVDGVEFSGWLFRMSHAGIADVNWRLPSDFQITEQYLAPDSTPIVQAYVKNSPTYEKRWYRLTRESIGKIVPAEIANTAQLPPRDSINLQRTSGLGSRLLPLSDGSTISFEIAVASAPTPAPPPTSTATYALRKRDARGSEQWSRVIDGRVHNLASDTLGNVYVLGEAVSISGKTANLLRLGSDGTLDAAWNPSIDVASNVSSIARVVSDRIIVADAISGSPNVNRLTTFDLASGSKLTERYPEFAFTGITDDGTVLSTHADGHWALLDARKNDTSHDRVSDARIGQTAYISAALRWNDGYVLGGNFLYWFDGNLYRNIMRIDAAFRLDPTWTPQIDGTVAALAVDAQARLIVGSNSASGREAKLTRFRADKTLDRRWNPLVTGDIYKIYPVSDGILYIGGAYSAIDGVARRSIARFRSDDTLDGDWASKPSWPVLDAVRYGQFGRDGIYDILDTGNNGVYFSWEDGYSNGADSGIVRLARDGVGAELSVPRGAGFGPRDPATGVVYGIGDAWELTSGRERGSALIRLVPPTMNVDVAWTTYAGEHGRQFAGFAYQTSEHIYVCRGRNVWLDIELRRFDKMTGREDPVWRSDERYLCNATSFERGADSTTVFGAAFDGALTRFSTTATNEPMSVIEYYSHVAKRFFITARADEIALLDAQSANFIRTGMQFSAVAATVRSGDTTSAPICRFYSPPEAGGSNTHFYGRDSDCTMLKRFPTLRYEGYDFRTGLPESGGACPSALPQPVYRLFNQVTASNSGNHRYVVSEARKNEMNAAGWISEGVAFCTTSVTDSRSLAEITQ